jgi:predicted nucleotidyltransferase
MKACAVIAEFNPFHNGHQFLLKKARTVTNADLMIIIMSGNFVQRGEPALINKWERARIAIDCGADLVVEIPTEYAIESAKEFAHAGIDIAHKLGAEFLAFGSENPNLDFENESKILDRQFSLENKKYNQNFAAQLFADTSIASSNDILGINYAYWNSKLDSKMQLVPIQREQSEHLDTKIEGNIASASAIRGALLKQKDNYQEAIPTRTLEVLTHSKLVSWEDFWTMLNYRLRSSTADELGQIRGIKEGFENRILDVVGDSSSFAELMEKLKTKRYTYTNIQRNLVNIFLNIKPINFSISKTRLLAANSLGRDFIRENELKSVIMTKVTKEDFESDYAITKRADDLYRLISPYQWGNSPIIK